MPKTPTTKIFDQALSYLSRRDYSERELKYKLLRQHPDEFLAIEAALSKLKTLSYLNDQRFLTGRIHHRQSQGYGTERILLELTKIHGFDKRDVLKILQADKQQNQDVLKTLIAKKSAKLNLQDLHSRNKLIAYCLQRGFRFEEIKQALCLVSAQSPDAAPD